jgi:NADPH2:quinone reductase
MTTPSTAKAITFAKNGGPEVLELTENYPIPEVSPSEILIKVGYAGVNFLDAMIR